MNETNYLKKSAFRLVMLIALLAPVSVWAQVAPFNGTVVNSVGEPIIGASVIEKGTSNGVSSDANGNFTLNLPSESIITVSFIGYVTQEVNVAGKTSATITLKDDAELLDEVVVVGYGTMKRSDMTGAISSVKAEDLTKRSTSSAAEALQGKVAGVNILRSGGNAGAGITVKIRGVKTMGSNEPLYVIDGYPGDINTINPQDIESMEILKDGAAAAIYGSVAANGVILVTTKNGKKGDVKVTVNAYMALNSIANKFEMLDANGYLNVFNMMYGNAGVQKPNYLTKTNPDGSIKNPTGFNTDWQDQMLRNGIAQNYYINVVGGSENANYAMSYGRSDEKGVFLGNNYVQDNARIKANVKKYIFDIDGTLNFKATQNEQPQYSIKEMYGISPLVPIYDANQVSGYGLTAMSANGESFTFPVHRNVMADNDMRQRKINGYNITANVGLGIKFAPWLSFKSTYTFNGYYEREMYHRSKYTANPKEPFLYPYNYEAHSFFYAQTLENVLSFNKNYDKHSIAALVGSSIITNRKDDTDISVEGKKTIYDVVGGSLTSTEVPGGFLDPDSPTIDAGKGGTYIGNGTFYEYNRASFFGRVNYSYDGRYMLQATLRTDGSSKFGKNNRWGTFPSVAVGWRISEEKFFPKMALNNLKLRASWGRLGNENNLGYYYSPAMTNSNRQSFSYVQGNNPWLGMVNLYLENDDLRWETTDTKNIGVDFGLFNNKLTGSLNYYYNKTEDLLIEKVMAPSAGIYNPTVNVGVMTNQGFELELNYANRVNDFDYNIGLNLTTIRNKMLQADPNQVLYGSPWKGEGHFVNQTLKGFPVAAYFLYKTAGIFQSDAEAAAYINKDGQRLQPNAKAGDIKFVDVDNSGDIDSEDKVYMGSGIPKVEANLSFSGAYKGFDLSFQFSGAWGNKLYNANRLFYESMDAGINMFSTTKNAWTATNTNTSMPRSVLGDPNQNSRESDRFLESGNFVRLRQLQLGYTLPASLTKKVFIEKCRFYVSAENLFTITKYSGIDPEFSPVDPEGIYNGVNILNTGVDSFVYPFTRSVIFGVQITF